MKTVYNEAGKHQCLLLLCLQLLIGCTASSNQPRACLCPSVALAPSVALRTAIPDNTCMTTIVSYGVSEGCC